MSLSTRAVLLGLRCPFSTPSLVALLRGGIEVAAVILPAPAGLRRSITLRELPILGRTRNSTVRGAPRVLTVTAGEPTIVDVAAAHGVPVYEVGRLDAAETLDALARLRPDVIVVACFTRRLPRAWLDLPPLGCLNVHPSLLPDNRGPEPLFWTFRRGDALTGVTVHRMDAGLDAGPILAQTEVPVPDGIGGHELERTCAAAGADLLLNSIRSLASGTASLREQDESRATVYHQPTPEDFVISPDWPARRAFNFARGAAYWGHPTIRLDGRELTVAQAVSYDPTATLDAACQMEGLHLRLRCSPGVLHVVVGPPNRRPRAN